MSSKATLAVLAGLFACAGLGSAQADIEPNRDNGKFTCPGSAIKQNWMLISTSNDPVYCKLSVDSKNKMKGDCFGSGEPDSKLKASGSLSVNSKCEVSGDITFSGGDVGSAKAEINANMTKSQTTIIGITVGKGAGKGQFGTFTAVRMEQ
jgi:hypothetical protein